MELETPEPVHVDTVDTAHGPVHLELLADGGLLLTVASQHLRITVPEARAVRALLGDPRFYPL